MKVDLDFDRGILTRGVDALRHRGPDDRGEWWSDEGDVGLGHRRLSIIDLSAAGRQPFTDRDGRLVIVFNGEIYNYVELREELVLLGHSFVTKTDTEVILVAYKQWKNRCVERLDGMFSFAIYDSIERSLFLARDRAGEKPMFYYKDDSRFCFASEIKGLFADESLPRRIDPNGLDCYLALGFVPGGGCILRGYNKLSPAHAALYSVTKGTLNVWRYWSPPEVCVSDEVDVPDLLAELESRFGGGVKRQMVADVPVGVLLSGGVDSSLITAMAARCSAKLSTFTVRFPGYGKYDETVHARLVANAFGTDHHELDAQAIDFSNIQDLARQFDEPIVDSSMVPTYLVSKLVRNYCTVALGGDGGDELFGGYPHYSRMLAMQKLSGAVARALFGGIINLVWEHVGYGVSGRNWLRSFSVDFSRSLPTISPYFDLERERLMSRCSVWNVVAEDVRENRIPVNRDLVQRATRMDFENYLSEDILVKVDRASMLSSLEMRAPLLDRNILEFAFGKVPSKLKARKNGRKILLKMLAAKVLPASFDIDRKQGFSIPLDSWLRGGKWEEEFRGVLLDESQTSFNRGLVNELFEDQRRGRSNSERLFALVLFEIWRKSYGISF